MPTYTPSHSPVCQQLFAPVTKVYSKSETKYDCPTIADLDFLEMGVLRCLSESKTGRDFIQRHGDNDRLDVTTDHFFKALKSTRRIANLKSINALIKPIVKLHALDPFESIPELSGFALYAGDGHFHAGAVHDPTRSSENGGARKPATGHFFMINLRTHYMSHLGTSDLTNGRKGEHDMHLIKRSEIDLLRGFERKGTKVILVWDKAGIDFRFWHKAKMTSGLYFISREKDNMKLIPCGDRVFDHQDPRNAGVISDEQVGPGSGGGLLRRIVYQDPETKEIYIFITTEMTLPPGIICLLYKQRWDIEKIFDEYKNKLEEKKSWGSGNETKITHALFLCLTHNLLIILEAILVGEGVTNDLELKRKKERLEKSQKNGANFVSTFVQRFSVRCLKFIRWLRNFVYRKAPWDAAKARLTIDYAKK